MKNILKQIPDKKQNFGEITNQILEELDELEAELMKRGTLAADSMDWQKISKKAEALLSNVCHLQAYRALIVSLSIPDSSGLISEESLTTAFIVTQHLTEKAWPDMHPQGLRQKRKREAWMNDIVQALNLAVEQVNAQGGLSRSCLKSAEKLTKILERKGLGGSALAQGLKKVPQNLSDTPIKAQSQPTCSSPIVKITEAGAPPVPQRLNAKGRVELRRDIQALADRIAQHEADAGIAWLMRGYASWLEYSQAPEVKDKSGAIGQSSMPAFVTEEHLKNAASPDMSALKKLEDRLFMSPDWFEGQKLVADMAQALGMPESAVAIRQRVQDRLARLPELHDLKYQNGTDIVPQTIKLWLAETNSQKPHYSHSETEETICDDHQDPLALAEIQISQARSSREAAIAQLSFARTLAASGHQHHARLITEGLIRYLSVPALQEWDSHLLAELKELNEQCT